MTLSAAANRVSYSANGVLTSFAIPFDFKSTNSYVQVYTRDESDLTSVIETLQVYSTDYTISGSNVVFNTAPANGLKVVLIRTVPLSQDVDLVQNGPFDFASNESLYDRIVMGLQQISESVARAVKFKASSSSADKSLPEPVDGKLLRWNASGNLENADVSVVSSGAITTPLAVTLGGTGQSAYASGDMLYASAANTLSRRAKSTDGKVWTLVSGFPNWANTQAAALVIQTKTANYNVLSTDDVMVGSSVGGTFTFTLPSVTGLSGKVFYFRKTNSDNVKISISGTGLSTSIISQNEVLSVYCDGTNYAVLNRSYPKNWATGLTFVPANFGTIASTDYRWRREGDSMHVRLTFASGTPAGAAAGFAMPTGYVIDLAKSTASANAAQMGRAQRLNVSGATNLFGDTNEFMLFNDGSSTANVLLARNSGSSQFTTVNANALVNSSDILVCDALIPITDWAA